ncbi:MAG TPA: glycoside hydrolase family 15 protein [Mesorhizobium sp.]|jgi:GH15 family glucan-1,4-alpha-glucosidase|nr:glycoside hydrolase family 15 protein [Mesorhizobium sp.]
MPSRIEDYALIGDCETAALVARDGSIDWLCWPRFDSGACFAALLGGPEHGRWRIAPDVPAGSPDAAVRVTRRYRPDTLILETEFETADGAVTLIDFMPPRSGASDLVRLVVGRRGRVRLCTELAIRFDYGAVVPWVTRLPDGLDLQAVAGPDRVVLHTPVELHGENLKSVGAFTVAAGETVPFVLTYNPSHLPFPRRIDPQAALIETEAFWRDWAGRSLEAGEWSQMAQRSLITLKALTYAPTGGVVAAPTTSLPEEIGGTRNWDYRYCWLRDATLMLLAMMNAGHYEEAQAWRDWLLRAVAGSPRQMQIMYGVAGERRLSEWEIPWLPGYEGSKPVRVGNAAYGQLQLDVFGELMDALHQARMGGLGATESGWALQKALLEHLEKVWQEPDEGIWEVRGPRQHFTCSKVMAWLAFDRALASARTFGLEGPVERWEVLRRTIHEEVCRRGFDPELDSFVQAYGSKQFDASLLLLPAVGFLPPEDPRVRGTVAAVERNLMEDGLVLRYRTEETADGLPPGEGAFLACSFWLVDCYVMQGRMEQARELFDRLLSIASDVGLLAEEYNPRAQRQVGNFPQAFSHFALINSIHNLSRATKPVEQRSQTAAPA